jgi:hypothetical protein
VHPIDAVGTFGIPYGSDVFLSAAYPNASVSGEMFYLTEGTFTQRGVAANLSQNQIVDTISVRGSIVSTDALRRIATPGSATRPR